MSTPPPQKLVWRPATDNESNFISLQGFVKITYDEIVKALGPPHTLHPDEPGEPDPEGYDCYGEHKVKARWELTFTDPEQPCRKAVAAINDWKQHHVPKGPHNWMIRGHSSDAVYLMKLALKLEDGRSS